MSTAPDTAERPQRPRGGQQLLRVDRTERLSPGFVRLHFGGPGVHRFLDDADPQKLAMSDRYVKLLFAKPELGLTPPYDFDALRERLPLEDLPSRRTYTVRSIDPAAGTIAIDFVVHGDDGVAGPWAVRAQPGDVVVAASGPGGGFAPDDAPDAEYLLLGDESALPAIASTLEALAPDATGLALIEVAGPAEEQGLTHPAGVRIRWLHRAATGAEPGTLLVDAVRALAPVPGARVFAHGERGAMKRVRVVLTDGWGLDRRSLSLSAYWALGRAEDAFQAEKRTPVGQL